MKPIALTLAALLAALQLHAHAQRVLPPMPPQSLGVAERQAVIAQLNQQLVDHYVFPDRAKQLGAALMDKEANGGYAAVHDTVALAKALSDDLQTQGEDLHLVVRFDPEFKPAPAIEETPIDTVLDPQAVESMAAIGYGVEAVQRLPGNVGYLEVRGFGPTEVVAPALSAAMLLLHGTDALILDLRRNRGGSPRSVVYLLSHFFALGDERHLNSIYSRKDDRTQQFWTHTAVMPRYLKPIFVLTSGQTFSGGEECAYDLQTQQRATVVGEATGGGANPGQRFALGHGLTAFIPTGRSINPITHTNWEHVGVQPDVPVAASRARSVAYVTILKGLLAKAASVNDREGLYLALTQAETEAAAGP
ncbi:MAG: S41 family peptidase [Proteobacteria bacterium]|nr:S41 family peptidase [Pseudomonadota bacterium]